MSQNAGNVVEILARIKTSMKEEEAVRKKLKLLGWCFPMIILISFVTFFYSTYSTVVEVDKEKFISRLEENSVRLWPKIGDEMTKLGEKLYPHYADEAGKALNQAIPDLEKQFAAELETFETTLNERMSAKLSSTYLAMGAQQKTILLEAFPELEGDEKKTAEMLSLVQSASITYIKDLVGEALKEHTVAFMDLRNMLDRNYRMELGEDEVVDPEDLLTTWLDILDESIMGEATIIDPNAKVKKKAGKPQAKGGE